MTRVRINTPIRRRVVPKFSLLDCLHMLDGNNKVGSVIHCPDCKHARVVVVVRPLRGAYVVKCQSCPYSISTGSARTLSEMYASRHEHPTSVEWVRDANQNTDLGGF